MKRYVWGLLLLLGIVLSLPTAVRADGPVTPGYTLNDSGKRVPAPTAYIYAGYLGGEEQAAGIFADPQDLFRDPATGHLVVADTGNNRIVVLSTAGAVIQEVGVGDLLAPEGVFVDSTGAFWVADTGNARVAHYAPTGEWLGAYTRPDSRYLEDREFSPSKIVVDQRGFIYLVTGKEGDLGVVVMDSQENFRGFFGRTRVPFNLGRVVARTIATQEQRQRMLRVRPAPLGNMHLDASGFLYAVSPVLKINQIQRLNSVGENIYSGALTGSGLDELLSRMQGEEGKPYGESEIKQRWDADWNMMVPYRIGSTFADVAVDDLGVISALDQQYYNVYQYDQAGNLLAIFGGNGQREGSLARPTSLAAGEGGTLYVLDAARGNIQVFRPTELMRLIHAASYAHYNGRYDEAAALWGEIARRNTNLTLAHAGLGKALLRQGNYTAAMQEYRYAEDKTGYSTAFREYRYHWLRENFNAVGLAVLGVLVSSSLAAPALTRGVERVTREARRLQEAEALWPVGVLLALALLMRMLSLSLVSFPFSTQRPEDIRLLFEGGKLLIPWISWCLASLAVSEIFYGEGTFRQIVVSSAWALWPFIVLALPLTLVTHWLSLDEAALYNAGWSLVAILVGWQFFQQVRTLHAFDVRQTLIVIALSLVGMGLLWALVGLVYALSSEIVRFIRSLILEIYVRQF